MVNDVENGNNNDGLSLNIFCDTQQQQQYGSTSTALKNKKRRKNNKYEKRRNKARQAKEQKQKQKEEQEEKNNSKRQQQQRPQKQYGNKDGNDNDNVKDTDDSEKSHQEDEDNDKEDGGDVDKNKNVCTSAKALKDSESKLTATTIGITSSSSSSTLPSSRRNAKQLSLLQQLEEGGGRADNNENINDDDIAKIEQRAKYLSEFHAHPLEIDRRSGVTRRNNIDKRINKRSTQQEESTHIFDDDDDNNDTDDDENKNDDTDDDDDNSKNNSSSKTHGTLVTKNAANLDGWDQFSVNNRIHSKFLLTLKKTLKLDRGPTIIQKRSINAFLSFNNKKNKNSNKNIYHDDDNTIPNNNIVVQSETGSGKTLAYLLPILQTLAVDETDPQNFKTINRTDGGTRCIILCPTRELASQILTTVEIICRNTCSWIVPGCLVGGEKRKSEKARIRKGITILIATPGRLLDHLSKTESLLMSLKKGPKLLEWLVLDEADRLLDMGLGQQIVQIIQYLRTNTSRAGRNKDGITWRSVLVSATVTNAVEEYVSKKVMLGGNNSWVWVKASKSEVLATSKKSSSSLQVEDGESSQLKDNNNNLEDMKDTSMTNGDDSLLTNSTPKQLIQLHITVTAKLRLTTLIAFLMQRIQNNERTVVFMSTCDGVDYHYALFNAMSSILGSAEDGRDDLDDISDDNEKGIFGNKCPIYKLHGNVPHSERHLILKKFAASNSNNKTKNSSILLATDVAARGLNLPGVDWIVQYDPPCEVADYVHRAGRVARAGKAGRSLLFLLPSERQYLDILKLKGLHNMTPLSLTSTLNTAAEICEKDFISSSNDDNKKKFNKKSPANSSYSSRSGESFCFQLQRRLEDLVTEDDIKTREAYKEKLKQIRKNSKNNKRNGKQRQSEKELQQHLQQNVSGELLDMARNAYVSFIRSYPTKEKIVKHIFSARAIHLGHIARSFALKEQPKSLVRKARVGSQNGRNTNNGDQDGDSKSNRKRNALDFSVLKSIHNEASSTSEEENSMHDDHRRTMKMIGADKDEDEDETRVSNNKKPGMAKKRRRIGGGSTSFDDKNPKHGKSMFLANAAKLQAGMESF